MNTISEFLEAGEIQKLQWELLQKQWQYVLTYSPFYKNAFQGDFNKLGSLHTLEDFKALPFTTKDDLQQFNDDFLCVPRNQLREYVSTSGTMGRPVSIALNQYDISRLAYNEYVSFVCAGAGQEDVFQLMLTLDRQFMAGIAYYEGVRKLEACSIRTGPGLPPMQWDAIFKYKPTFLIAVPSFVVKMLDYAKEHKINPNDSSVKKIICIGENIRQMDLNKNVLAQRILQQWDVDLISTYASTEMQTAFTECTHQCGGHHHPDLLFVEILNERDEEITDGEIGEIVISNLGVQAMPLLRYRTGDMATKFSSPCACGRNSMRISPITGRKQQMIKLKGTSIYPAGIFEILQSHKELSDFVVELKHNELMTDDIKLFLCSSESDKVSLSKKILSSFQSRIRVMPELEWLEWNQLEKMLMAGTGRKMNRLIDNRQTQIK